MSDFKTGAEITPTKPEVGVFVPTDELQRVLEQSTKTLHEMQLEFEFLWSLTDKSSTMRPTPEGLKEREFKLRKWTAYVVFLQNTLTARAAAEEAAKVAAEEKKAEDELIAELDAEDAKDEDGV